MLYLLYTVFDWQYTCSISTFQIVFDNIDVYLEVHDMNEENQNIDRHDCVKAYVSNRIGGNHLQSDKPRCDLMM